MWAIKRNTNHFSLLSSTSVCMGCLSTVTSILRDDTKDVICLKCNKSAKLAFWNKSRQHVQENPNQARITSIFFSKMDEKTPFIVKNLTRETKQEELMKQIEQFLGLNMAEVEGGFMDYKLVYRDRYINPGETMGDVGWYNGIAKMQLVGVRTPCALSDILLGH